MNARWAKLVESVKKHKFSIMSLPWDVRHRVLEYCCDRNSMPVFLRGVRGLPPTAIPLPVSARAGDKTLRLETILVAIKQATLEIHSGPGNANLQSWLNSLDLSAIKGETGLRAGVEAIHSLSFPYFSRFPHRSLPSTNPNNDIVLVLKCVNLRKLSLNFVSHELLDYTHPYFEDKSVVQLRQEYRLDSILPLLHRIEFKSLALSGPSKGLIGHDALEALAAWFRWEYAIRANITHFDAKGPTRYLSVKINGI